jgi:hypothetical protein
MEVFYAAEAGGVELSRRIGWSIGSGRGATLPHVEMGKVRGAANQRGLQNKNAAAGVPGRGGCCVGGVIDQGKMPRTAYA